MIRFNIHRNGNFVVIHRKTQAGRQNKLAELKAECYDETSARALEKIFRRLLPDDYFQYKKTYNLVETVKLSTWFTDLSSKHPIIDTEDGELDIRDYWKIMRFDDSIEIQETEDEL